MKAFKSNVIAKIVHGRGYVGVELSPWGKLANTIPERHQAECEDKRKQE